MKETRSKSELAIILSGLGGFKEPKVRQEQYIMDSEVGASMLWNAKLLGDITGKRIADLGCGTGILGIGALLLGAEEVLFIDSDKNALETAKNNVLKVKSEGYKLGKKVILCKDIRDVNRAIQENGLKPDLVVQNPPFGTKKKHNDVIFLKNAIEIAPIVYSFHKSETKVFLERLLAKNSARITHIWDYKFPIKASFAFHRRQIQRINASCLRIERP